MTDKHKCPNCTQTFGSEAELKGHMAASHDYHPTNDDNPDMTDNDDSGRSDDVQQLEGIRTELSQLNNRLEEFIQTLQGAQALANERAAGDDEEETDTSVTVEHDHDTDALENAAYDWIQSYAEFNDAVIPEAVEIEFAQVEGEVGLKIDAGAPWNADCHNGNEWTDREKWDAHTDAFRELMQGKDEIEYYGEPDYFNFLPATDVEEVI